MRPRVSAYNCEFVSWIEDQEIPQVTTDEPILQGVSSACIDCTVNSEFPL